MLLTESSASRASLIRTLHQIDGSKQYQIFVEGSQVLHLPCYGGKLELVPLFRVSRPWSKKRKRKRSRSPRFFIRWWMTGGSGLRRLMNYGSRGVRFGFLGSNEWWSQMLPWHCFQKLVSKADSRRRRVRRGNQLMLKQSRHGRVCMNWRGLKVLKIHDLQLAVMST